MSTSKARTHVVLVGMMGAGKTTTGLALAARLGWPLRDGDRDLEARTGRTGAELAAAHGVGHLHALEEQVVLDALASEEPMVVAAAGSVVDSASVRDAFARRATVVWLDVPVGELMVRMAAASHRRPLERPEAAELLTRRRAELAAVADLHLDARRPTDELVEAVVHALDPARSDDRSGDGSA